MMKSTNKRYIAAVKKLGEMRFNLGMSGCRCPDYEMREFAAGVAYGLGVILTDLLDDAARECDRLYEENRRALDSSDPRLATAYREVERKLKPKNKKGARK